MIGANQHIEDNRRLWVALVVGHSQERGGADGEIRSRILRRRESWSEYRYNEMLVGKIFQYLGVAGRVALGFMVFGGDKSLKQRDKALSALGQNGPELSIEFHCNAFDKKASGTEMLVPSGAGIPGQMSRYMAGKLAAQMAGRVSRVLGIRNRGVVVVRRRGRGSTFLYGGEGRLPKEPGIRIIAESFFIDNSADLRKGLKKIHEIAKAYADVIIEAIPELERIYRSAGTS